MILFLTSIKETHCPQNSKTIGTSCVIGSSCTNGRAKLCPPGAFNDDSDTGLCNACLAGNYSPYHGGVECTEKCADGFYCENGAASGYPSREEEPGFGICPAGSFCKDGVRNVCPPGTYQDRIGQSICFDCPAGYYCNDQNITDFSTYECPEGQFCLKGTTTPSDCPAGKFRNATKGRTEDDCQYCDPGYMCQDWLKQIE